MPTITPLQTINAVATTLASRREVLADIVRAIEAEHRATMNKHRARLRAAYNAVAAGTSDLHAEIAAHPELFLQPRTFVIAGLKIGFQKGKGKVLIADEPKTIALIRKHLDPDAAATLIKTEESVIKKAACNLPASDLKRLGIEITDAGDTVVIAPVDTALDKLLERLIEEAGKEEA